MQNVILQKSRHSILIKRTCLAYAHMTVSICLYVRRSIVRSACVMKLSNLQSWSLLTANRK